MLLRCEMMKRTDLQGDKFQMAQERRRVQTCVRACVRACVVRGVRGGAGLRAHAVVVLL